jgi:hypothetical protein
MRMPRLRRGVVEADAVAVVEGLLGSVDLEPAVADFADFADQFADEAGESKAPMSS